MDAARSVGWRRGAATLAAAALLVGACQAGATPAPTPAPTAAPTATAAGTPAPTGPTLSGKLRFDLLAYDAKMEAEFKQIEQDFEKANPGVDVLFEIPNLDTYRDSLTTQAQGGSPPDVAQVATSWMPPLADAGVLRDWRDPTSIDPKILEAMDPALRDGAAYKGKLTGLSYGSSARAVFYNQDSFDKAGLTGVPATWDELVAAARAIKKAGSARRAFFYEGKGQEAMAAWFPYVYWSFGGALADANGKLKIDKDACVQGLTIYDTMNKEGLLGPNVTADDFTGQRKAMSNGDAAMTVTGPWLIGMMVEDKSTVKYGTFPIPKGTTQATVGVTDAYVFFKDSKNPEAAKALVEFIMEPARNLAFNLGRGFLPVYTQHFGLPEFQTGPTKAFTDALPSAKFVPLDPNWTAFDKVGTNAVTKMFLEGGGPEKACQEMIDGLAGIGQ